MEVNKELLDSLNNIYFKVTDTQKRKTYITYDNCLYNTTANFIYKTDLQVISENEISCTIEEEKELETKAKKPNLGKKVDENIKFLKPTSIPNRE